MMERRLSAIQVEITQIRGDLNVARNTMESLEAHTLEDFRRRIERLEQKVDALGSQ
jgi:hypothetical protein